MIATTLPVSLTIRIRPRPAIVAAARRKLARREGNRQVGSLWLMIWFFERDKQPTTKGV
jgi:hypothetical protein